MHLQTVTSVLALATFGGAFSDSSPFVLLSTAAIGKEASLDQIQFQTGSQAVKYSKEFLSKCPTDRYLVATQPGLRATDLEYPENCKMTHLCQAAQDSRIQGKYVVVEIVGEMEMRGISDFIEEACAEKSKAVTVEELRLAHPSHKRDASLAGNDNIFAQSLEAIAEGNSYTILFLSPGEPRYEPEFEEALHMDVKRQLEDTVLRRRDNATQWQNASLFDKYQFFSPGIFMGLITVIVLFSIAFVGIKALSSLEVSYGAFSKEMGPSQQKKQQ